MRLFESDIHNHLLPCVDDGFSSVNDSLSAIRKMAEAGCRNIVFTPHINEIIYPGMTEQVLREMYSNFKTLIPQDWGIETSLAAEYMIGEGFERRVADKKDTLLCYADKSILVEMSYYFRSPNLEESLFQLQLAGYNPILAHPERYLYMVDCLGDFDLLRERGCRFQLNYISFTGAYGSDSVKIIKYLEKKGWCDFIASDLHSLHQLDIILSHKPKFSLRNYIR